MPYAPMASPPSHSMRPGARLSAVSMNALYSGYDLAVKLAADPLSYPV